MAFNYSPKIVTDGLVLYWDAANPRSCISGSTSWNDISRSGLNGGLFNFALFDSDNGGNVSFPGLSSYASTNIPSITSSIQTNNALTLSVVFKGNFTGEYRDVIGINKTSGNNPFVIRIDISNNLFYDTTVGGTRYTPRFATGTYTSGVWYHACATFGNNTITTYLNGRSVNQQVTSGALLSFTSTEFGVTALGYGFYKGDVANTQLYNRALTAQEVLQNYNATKTRFGLT